MIFVKIKRQIEMKMKMTDICLKCQKILRLKNINPSIISQSIETMFGVRSKMLSVEMFKSSRRDSRVIFCEKGNPVLVDLDNNKVKLTPLKADFIPFFIRNQERSKANSIS